MKRKLIHCFLITVLLSLLAGCDENKDNKEIETNKPTVTAEATKEPEEVVNGTEQDAEKDDSNDPSVTDVPEKPTDIPEEGKVDTKKVAVYQISAEDIGTETVFGQFEQDNNLDNGPEPITWQVLTVKDGKALLVSRDCLEYMPFNTNQTEYRFWWSTSSIRTWLNSDFINSAFSFEESDLIVYGEINNDIDDESWGQMFGCGGTFDKVFLLSNNEVREYMSEEYSEFRYSPASAYAESKGLNKTSKEASDWYIRTPGRVNNSAIYTEGGYWSQEATDRSYGIRPAMWVWVDEEARVNSTKIPDPVSLDFSAAKAGDIITFGEYEQDNSNENGTDPLEWIVLDVDGDRALIVTRYCIENMKFHDSWPEGNLIYWEMSSIRKWLNGFFMEEAFSDRERALVLKTTVSTETSIRFDNSDRVDCGPDTKDYAFLLSEEDVEKYLTTDLSRVSRATDYAAYNGLRVEKYKEMIGSEWFTRTPASFQYMNIQYSTRGFWTQSQAPTLAGIRPAMWIKIK